MPNGRPFRERLARTTATVRNVVGLFGPAIDELNESGVGLGGEEMRLPNGKRMLTCRHV